MLDLIRDCTLPGQNIVAYSARPQFRAVAVAHGGFFVRVALGPTDDGDADADGVDRTFDQVVARAGGGGVGGASRGAHASMRYKCGRIVRVEELAEPYRVRGLLADAELVLDSMPGARVRLTAISNAPITLDEFLLYNAECGAAGDAAGAAQQQLVVTVAAEIDPVTGAVTAEQRTDDSRLRALAAALRAAWRDDIVNHVMTQAEEGQLLERNEKLCRARRNLANDIKICTNRLEVALQIAAATGAAAASQAQAQSQSQLQAPSVAGADFSTQAFTSNESQQPPQPSPSSQQQQQLTPRCASQLEYARTIAPDLVDQLLRANERFSTYVLSNQEATSELGLVRLTERNRRQNEMLMLRGEKLRAQRDQRMGGGDVVLENIWTLDAQERADLAKKFGAAAMEDTEKAATGSEAELAAARAREKRQRIQDCAEREAAEAASQHEHAGDALAYFGGAEMLQRLVRDASVSASMARGGSNAASSQGGGVGVRGGDGGGGANAGAQSPRSPAVVGSSQTELFVLPRRRSRDEFAAGAASPGGMTTQRSVSGYLGVPQNSLAA